MPSPAYYEAKQITQLFSQNGNVDVKDFLFKMQAYPCIYIMAKCVRFSQPGFSFHWQDVFDVEMSHFKHL